jgi:hypothetical protein
MIETNIVWFESCALEDVRRMDSSQLTRDQQGLLNFDEFVALLYFIITVWYGCARYRNSRFASEQQTNRNYAHSIARHQFSPIHWAILSIAIMGLANFLFSLSLLEIIDHKSSIGSTVLKFSYVSKWTTRITYSVPVNIMHRSYTRSLIREGEFGSDLIFLCLDYFSLSLFHKNRHGVRLSPSSLHSEFGCPGSDGCFW